MENMEETKNLPPFYFPNLSTIQLTFVPYFPNHFTIQLRAIPEKSVSWGQNAHEI
jgi:hypothetical protein